MKNAIEAEKAKSAKIENYLKLKVEALFDNFALDLELHKSVIIRLKKAKYASEKAQKANLKAYLSKLVAEKITNAKLKWELEPLRSIIIDLKDKLAAEHATNAKLLWELEPLQNVISDMKTAKAMYRKINFDLENEKITLKAELEAQKDAVVDLKLVLKTRPAKNDEITARWEEQVIINQDLKIALQKQYRDIYNLKAELKVTKDIETKFEYMKTKFDNEKKYNSELNDVIGRLYAIINNRKFED
jgi:chromosome segregation ATPase